MATTEQYLRQLQKDKEELIANLQNAGIDISENATFRDISTTPLSANILNGIVKQYKAYAEENDVTISVGTFVEFVKTVDAIEFSNKRVYFIDVYDNDKVFIVYTVGSNINCAFITINKTITIINEQQLFSGSINVMVNAFVKESDGYVLNIQNKLIKVTITNNNFTLSNVLDFRCLYNIIYLETVGNIKYYASNYADNGKWYIRVFKIENNVITLEDTTTTAFSFSNIYSTTGGDMYVSGNKLLILAYGNGGSVTSYKFYSFNNGVLTEEISSNFSNKKSTISKMLNDKLYLIYSNNGLFVQRFTIDFANNLISSNSDEIKLLEDTEHYQFSRQDTKKLFLTDNLYLFYAVNSTQMGLLKIDLNTLNLTAKEIITGATVTSTISTFSSYLTATCFENKIIYAKAKIINNTTQNATIFYNIKTEDGISEGEKFVIPSVSKIEGLTKTDCTNLTLGDVWILNN